VEVAKIVDTPLKEVGCILKNISATNVVNIFAKCAEKVGALVVVLIVIKM